MKHWLAGIAGAVVAALVVAELAAVPLAERAVRDAMAGCVSAGEIELEGVGRPVVPGLLLGRARDVTLVGEGLVLGELRIDRARLDAPRVELPWAFGDAETGTAELEVELTEDDVAAAVVDLAPLGVELTVEFAPDEVVVGARHLPLEVRLELDAVDGELRFRPVAGDAAWWDRLGIYRDLELPEEVTVRDVEVAAGTLRGTLDVALPRGGGGGGACEVGSTTGGRR
ncbi:DUF2993 domain-containing protein [Nitriliruptoraceae bacterium ZYF776]|nr:DUF2993 domain-containing protein [Profundirhabdus halotolerans]